MIEVDNGAGGSDCNRSHTAYWAGSGMVAVIIEHLQGIIFGHGEIIQLRFGWRSLRRQGGVQQSSEKKAGEQNDREIRIPILTPILPLTDEVRRFSDNHTNLPAKNSQTNGAMKSE
jgi:hypothetical protein